MLAGVGGGGGAVDPHAGGMVVLKEEVPQASEPSLPGVPDGAPDVEHEFVGEGEVSERLVQRHGELVGVLLVATDLHHGGRWGGGGTSVHRLITQL